MTSIVNQRAKTERSSNIELLRIISMLLIVLHHYCVNSGFIELINPRQLTGNMVFIQFMSIGGKAGVNIFFLISGFFMIKSQMKWRKVLQLLFQIFSINVFVCIFLTSLGYTYGFKDYLQILPLIFSVPSNFVASYMVVYILTPIINKSLNILNRKEYNYLLIVLLTYFCLLQTFFLQNTWHYVGWGFTMYCVGAYINKYDLKDLNWNFGWISIGLISFIWLAIIIFDYLTMRFVQLPKYLWTFAIGDANKITVFLLGVSIFMWFCKLKIRHYKSINCMGGGIVLGVLLWHANNDIMRQWLWKDFLANTSYLNHDYLWLHCLLSVLAVYALCTILELIRHYLLDKPLLNRLEFQSKKIQK